MAASRLDVWLVTAGHVPSRARAVALIDAGAVSVNGKVACKAGLAVSPADKIELTQADHGYVSRGALKLKALIENLAIQQGNKAGQGNYFEQACVLDVGASTGGFTQVCLEYGARQVIAVDVGQGQLHPSLRTDPRVLVKEQTDARHLSDDSTIAAALPTILVADVSFIALEKVLPQVLAAVPTLQHLFLLIKPQFEVGREFVGKGGLVKNEQARAAALQKNIALIESLGFKVCLKSDCPVTGGDGNREFLVYAKR